MKSQIASLRTVGRSVLLSLSLAGGLAIAEPVFAQDDHGNTPATATNLPPGQSAGGVLNGNGDRDVFRLVLPGAGTLAVQTTSSLDSFGALLDSAGTQIASDDDSGPGLNFLITRQLNAGTYYVSVRGYRATTQGSYTLQTTFTPSGGGTPQPSETITGTGGAVIAYGSSASITNGTDFGSVDISTGSKTLVVAVGNSGQGPLTINGASLSGTNANQFRLDSQPASQVDPGRSTTFILVYDPSAVGTHNATVSLASNDPAHPTYTFSLRGVGTSAGGGGSDATAMLTLVNQARANAGLTALRLDDRLNQACLVHANDMQTNNFFSHTGSDGSQPWDRMERAGYLWRAAGENIAKGQSSVQAAFDAWMNSAGHRANILSTSYVDMGLAHVGPYWVQDFGAPR